MLHVDPVSLMNLPSKVSHDLAGTILSTRLSSLTIEFDASFDTQGSTEESLSLDWIEAGDYVCHINGICDKRFYDGETLDVPVHLPTSVTINTIVTPWNAFIDTTPSAVFYRDNRQEYVVKPWHNLKVVVEEPPPPPTVLFGHSYDYRYRNADRAKQPCRRLHLHLLRSRHTVWQ